MTVRPNQVRPPITSPLRASVDHGSTYVIVQVIVVPWLILKSELVKVLLPVLPPPGLQVIDVVCVASVVPSGSFACGRKSPLVLDGGVCPKSRRGVVLWDVTVTDRPRAASEAPRAEQPVLPVVDAVGYDWTQPLWSVISSHTV